MWRRTRVQHLNAHTLPTEYRNRCRTLELQIITTANNCSNFLDPFSTFFLRRIKTPIGSVCCVQFLTLNWGLIIYKKKDIHRTTLYFPYLFLELDKLHRCKLSPDIWYIFCDLSFSWSAALCEESNFSCEWEEIREKDK